MRCYVWTSSDVTTSSFYAQCSHSPSNLSSLSLSLSLSACLSPLPVPSSWHLLPISFSITAFSSSSSSGGCGCCWWLFTCWLRRYASHVHHHARLTSDALLLVIIPLYRGTRDLIDQKVPLKFPTYAGNIRAYMSSSCAQCDTSIVSNIATMHATRLLTIGRKVSLVNFGKVAV